MSNKINKIVNINNYLKNKIDINDLDFLGFVISGWHLNVLYSYLNANKDKFSKGLIVIDYQENINNKKKLRINKSIIKKIPNVNIKYIIREKHVKVNKLLMLKKMIVNNKKGNRDFTIISPTNLDFSLFKYIDNSFEPRNFSFVIIDEGTGTYVSKNSFYKALDMRFFPRVKEIIKLLIMKLFVIFINNNIEHYYLFKKDNSIFNNNKLKVNKKVALNFKKILENNMSENNNFINSGQILIFTDFIKKNNGLNELYIDIIEELKKVTNKKIYIKKHPNEINVKLETLISQYKNIEIINSNYDAEEVFLQYKPEIIIGGISTSLFSIAAIFNQKVINISELYLNPKYQVPKKTIDRIKKFRIYFSANKNVQYLEKINNLKKLIS